MKSKNYSSEAKNNSICTYAKVAGGYANFSYVNNLNNKYKYTPYYPPKINQKTKPRANTPLVVGDLIFEQFWNSYPKQINKLPVPQKHLEH